MALQVHRRRFVADFPSNKRWCVRYLAHDKEESKKEAGRKRTTKLSNRSDEQKLMAAQSTSDAGEACRIVLR